MRAERKQHMATKKNDTPVSEIPEKMAAPEEAAENNAELQRMQAELEKLRAENEKLKAKKPAANPYGSETDQERVRKACQEAAEAGEDPWKITISVKAPRRPAKEDPWYWLNVNGRSIQVPANDRYFELALPWAQTLTDMIAAEWLASDYQDSIEVFDPVTNPHRT